MSQTDETKDVRPPQAVLMEMAQGVWAAKALQVAADLGIADLIANESKTTEELSKTVQVNSDALYRLLRALASRGIFKEVGDNRFENTPISEAIRIDVPGSVRDYVIYVPNDGSILAWSKFMDVMKTGNPSYNEANGCEFWEYHQKHPELGQRFDGAMTALNAQVTSGLFESYDFSQFNRLIDVAGGRGTLLASILSKNPQLRGCLYEQSSVIEEAKPYLERRGVLDRCELISGDFFESIPEGYDAYLMSHVIHDWEDDQALAILRNCRAAIPKHGRLLILDAVLGKDNAPHLAKWLDLVLLVAVRGRERTEREFRNLLQASDFELKKVIDLPAAVAVIESEPV